MIPILDLVIQYQELKPEIDAAISSVLNRGVFIMGPNVAAFERELADFLGVKHAIGLNSGTDALHLALRALEVGPGDEVITSPFTFVATAEAIGIVGATPILVDIDPATFNINPVLIEAAITSRTKAILPVHLYGLPADMQSISNMARKRGIAVIEDCAQAIGASVDGKKVGTLGDIGCFSFFPSKNLGAYGDGGLACTDSDLVADRIKALRTHGGQKKYEHEFLGVNSRLDEIQAAILRVKLPHLEDWIRLRREVAARYSNALSDLPQVKVPQESMNSRHVYHQYTVRVSGRDRVRQMLTDVGIQTMIYYPSPLHRQKLWVEQGWPVASFPVSEAAAAEVLSLPMYPELSEVMQDIVIQAVRKNLLEPIPA